MYVYNDNGFRLRLSPYLKLQIKQNIYPENISSKISSILKENEMIDKLELDFFFKEMYQDYDYIPNEELHRVFTMVSENSDRRIFSVIEYILPHEFLDQIVKVREVM